MERQKAAKKFREHWLLAKDSELGGYQKFWISLLGDVLDAKDVLNRIDFQLAVPMGTTTKFLDAWIPETKVLIEHKKRGVKLDAPQSGYGGKTPYEQAAEYDNARGFDQKARWIVTCNFDEIRIYDRTRPLEDPEIVSLGNLPKELHRLAFLVNPEVKKVDAKELEISVQAGRIVGTLYDVLLKQYDDATPETLAALNRLCVRLVFCLYAEDADIFPKNAFRNLVKSTPVEFLRRQLLRLFQTLDTPIEKRDRYLEPELAAFPYTNGGLFDGASESEIPPLTEEIAKLLDGSSGFDWSGISPTIFGALFESTLNPETRRSGGMHYTSIENIHKLIDPLFLDDLTHRVDALLGELRVGEWRSGGVVNGANVKTLPISKSNTQLGIGNIGTGNISTMATLTKLPTLNSSTKKALLALQNEIASLKFLDPACGSGNFQTETYISLRRLENRIIAALQAGQGEFDLGDVVKVNIGQFYGIEINDFAVTVAKTALWIAESQMMKETEEIVHRSLSILPLKSYSNIVEGNALRMDWGKLGNGERGTGNGSFDYIIGNPPFVGARNKSPEQAADVEAIFGKKWKGLGNLDYVTCWYKKAVDYISAAKNAKNTKVAFVSTNSICQGDSVTTLWKPLFEEGLEIDFAWRTFRWDSESNDKAHVHCVIVGFHVNHAERNGRAACPQAAASGALWTTRPTDTRPKTIHNSDATIICANHINAYLMDGPDVWIESRTKPLCDVPEIGIGSQPIDDGNFLFTKEEMDDFVKKEPESAIHFHKWLGAQEFINAKERYCLWLGDCSPGKLRSMPECMKRVAAVRDFRLASKRIQTVKAADFPMRFGAEAIPDDNYILVPKVSSERRSYVPIGFFTPETFCSDLVFLIPSATLYHFGVLTSSVHMAWMRAVAGRLKSDYRYSAAIVYNNFPWPELQNVQSRSDLLCTVSKLAQAILDARALYPDSSLADLYDPLTMPPELRKAHAANDRAVLSAYGLAADTPEHEIVAHLFKLYSGMAEKEGR